MNDHLKQFANHAAYQAAESSLDTPNVSLCVSEGDVHYNPIIPPYVDGHEYVDLGLPSGTLWATMNVGAEDILDKGCRFSWGGTNENCCGDNANTKDHFYWDTYEFSTNGGSSAGTTDYKLNKYCPSGKSNNYYANGFSGDNLTQLLPVDDVVTTKWGEHWEIPTAAQFQELIDNTTREYTHDSSVITLTAQNGKTIDFPVSGSSWSPNSGTVCYPNYQYWVYLWTKELDTNTPQYAKRLSMADSSARIVSDNRSSGIPVRGVVKSSN